MKEFLIYIDESGNTGSNLIDYNQPFMTFVGIGFESNQVSLIDEGINKIKKKYRIGNELHTATLYRRNRENVLIDIFELISRNLTIPIFCTIVEKKFEIAALIDSDFFDPEYNVHCDVSWTWPSDRHRERANYLYENLTENTLLACGEFFRTGDSIKIATKMLKADLSDKRFKDEDLSYYIGGLQRNLPTLESFYKDRKNNAPNIMAFISLINRLEYFFNEMHPSIAHVRLICDNSRQYKKIFNDWFQLQSGPRRGKMYLYPDKIPLIAGCESLKHFEMKDSKKCNLLQCADFYATSFTKSLSKTLVENNPAKYKKIERIALLTLFGSWKEYQTVSCDMICSDVILKKFTRMVVATNVGG